AMYDSDTAKDTPKRGPCTEGTRTEVLNRIRAWAVDNSPSTPPIFWLSGRAGTGKSTVAYSVCRAFDSGDIRRGLGASFFCSRQVDDLRRLGNIVPTLAYQLARHSSSFARALRSVDHDAIHNSDKHIGHLLIHPWRSTSKDRPDDLPPTLIVIDALDEIDEDGGPELLRSLIKAMADEGPSCMRGLKILITSRPHPSIVDMAQSLSHDAIYHMEDIEKQKGREDIMKFLVNSLPELGTSYRDALEGLADLSNGLFIYAATVVRLISRRGLSTMQKAKRMTAIILEQNARPLRGESLLVDNLYADIIRDSINSHEDETKNFRLTALHGILCALRPLTIHELAELISEDSDDADPEAVRLLVDDLHAVTYISNDCIYTYHKSFSDFFFDERRCGQEIICEADASHHVLARGCFRIMKRSLRFNICNLPSSYLFDSEIKDLHESITKNITGVAGLVYACRNWPSHLIKICTASEALHCLLHQLLAFSQSEKVLFWIEVMNLLSAKVDCVNGVSAVMAWMAKLVSKTELQLALTAVSRLIKSFLQTPASLSTPHLYISSLAAEFASNLGIPSQWRTCFPSLPRLRFMGTSNHGSVLTRVYVGSTVYSIAISADGQRVVSGSLDKLVRIWDAFTGKGLQKLEGHTDRVTSVVFSIDGRRIVSGSYDNSVRIWDASTGSELKELRGHTGFVTSVAFSPNGHHVASGSNDKSVRIWDTFTGKELHKLQGHTHIVNSVAFSTVSGGLCVVSGSDDRSVRIWDASTGDELQQLGHTGIVTSVAVSADSQHVASGSGPVHIWDTSTGKLQEMEGHYGGVNSVAFSVDGQFVTAGSSDASVRIWDVPTGRELQKMEGHFNKVTSVAFSADGQRIVSGSYDNSVHIWDASSGEEVQRLEGYDQLVNTTTLSANRQRIVLGSTHPMCLYDVSTGSQLHEQLVDRSGWVISIAFTADGQRVVSSVSDGSVRVWDTSTRMGNYETEGEPDFEGWLIFKRPNHLIWLPVHLHPGLCNVNTRLISCIRHTTVDFAPACLGSDWTKCYIGSER
ncbi:uncharacterized protein STEHIDRAFT_59318, partial [Stereum hirsutum FP-91666 SS1]|uniref:uncharacterized protein n=1 Tax=Stereum hirsutum (strain FP-91666) TaxID=721885 RepID=UPI00044498F3